MICIDCNEEFLKKTIKKGKINQCNDCSKEADDIPRFLGFNDGTMNKMTNIAIYRGNDKQSRKMISNQKARTGI